MAGVLALLLVISGVWGVKVVRVARSIDTYRSYWAQPRGEPGGTVYVALGDSAAPSIGASSPELGYVGLLAERMRARTCQPVLVINLSSTGATVRDVVDTQLPQVESLAPDVVTVAIGGNDIRAYDTARFRAEIDELTAALPANTLIADVPYFMHAGWEKDAHAAAGILTDSALAQSLQVAPLHREQHDRGMSAMLTDFAADWFHPNDRGHRVWADALWTELQRMDALTPPAGCSPAE